MIQWLDDEESQNKGVEWLDEEKPKSISFPRLPSAPQNVIQSGWNTSRDMAIPDALFEPKTNAFEVMLTDPNVRLMDVDRYKVSPQQIHDAREVLSVYNRPFGSVNYQDELAKPSTPATVPEQVAAGIQHTGAELAAGISDPVMMPLMLAGGPAGKMVMAGFGAQAALHLPEEAARAGELSVTGTPMERAEAYSALPVSMAMILEAGRLHRTPAQVKTKPELKQDKGEVYDPPIEIKSEQPAIEAKTEVVTRPAEPVTTEAPPSEFAPPKEFKTSNQNAVVDAERVAVGQPPIMKPLRESNPSQWDAAMRRIEEDPGTPTKPGWQDRLINELTENPRAANPEENAALLHRRADITNEYNKSLRRWDEAFKAGETERAAAELTESNRLLGERSKLDKILDATGRESGQSLQARKMFVDQDFNLVTMVLEKQKAKGRELNETELSELAAMEKQFKAKSEAESKARIAAEERAAEAEYNVEWERLARESQPQYAPKILEIAEKFVSTLEKRATAARERISKYQGAFANPESGSVINPAILVDLAEIGAAKIARGTLDFVKWSNEMRLDVGEGIQPFLEDVWKASRDALNNSESTLAPAEAATIRERRTRRASEGDAIGNAIRAKVEAGERGNITPYVKRLSRMFREMGVNTREGLVDAVWGELKRIDPDFTRREAMDAMSGYGQFKQLSKGEIDIELRQWNGELQAIAKLEDMAAGKAPAKTGREQQSPSDEKRRLDALVNEAKKKGGYVITDPETQLRSAIQSIERRLTNQIADLELEIAFKSRIVKEKTTPPTSPEIEALRAQRDLLKQERDTLLGPRETTDAQRVVIAQRALERSITDLEQRIKTGNIAPRKAGSKTPSTPELEAARAKRDALRDQLQELRDLANPKATPEQRATAAWKRRVTNQIADLKDRVARNDYAPKPKKEPFDVSKDPEANRLGYELNQIRTKYAEGLMEDNLSRLKGISKALDIGAQTLNLLKNNKASVDFSGFWQALTATLMHPAIALKNAMPYFRSTFSDKKAFDLYKEAQNRENFKDGTYKRADLRIVDPYELNISRQEELARGRWANKVPWIKASNRGYVTFLNQMRMDIFDALYSTVGNKSPEAAKAIADFVNIHTGYGVAKGKAGQAVDLLAYGLWAPRRALSRVQALTGYNQIWGVHKVKGDPNKRFLKGTPETRKIIAKEYARLIAGLSVLYMAVNQFSDEEKYLTFGDEVLASDWMKARRGKTRIDPWGGHQQPVVAVSRMIRGETMTSGKLHPQRGAETGFEFLEMKRHPGIGLLSDAYAYGREQAGGRPAKNIVGEPITIESLIKDATVPLTFDNLVDGLKEHGFSEAMAHQALSLVGVSVNTFQDRKK